MKWTARVTSECTNEFITYETVPLPGLKTSWEVYFSPVAETGTTDVREVMNVPFGRLGRVGLALVGKPPSGEVPANLRRLKEVMETGTVTETSYAVAGKFTRS